MLLGLDDYAGNTRALRLKKRLAQKRIDLFAFIDRHYIIGALQIYEWNIGSRHERFNSDCLGGFGISGGDLLLA